jgi:AcrR family transcriptional regulator
MATKDEIKNAALRLFAAKGFEATTTNDIAAAVGLKKQSLYSHFNNKNSIYFEVLKDSSDYIWGKIQESIEEKKDRPTEELMKSILECMFGIFSDHECLLFWKRAFIVYGSGENKQIVEHADWQFDRKLKDELYREMCRRKEKPEDPAVFRRFFYLFMIFVQGYLDFMIIMGHNEDIWKNIWEDYWTCANRFFKGQSGK